MTVGVLNFDSCNSYRRKNGLKVMFLVKPPCNSAT